MTRRQLSLLIEGANPNAQDLPPPHLSLWKLLWDRLQGKPPASAKAPTALMLAVQDNVLIYSMHEGLIGYRPPEDTTLIQALLEYGADVSARNEEGETALQLAEDHPQVVALLKQAGAKK